MPLPSNRLVRVAELLKIEIATIIQRQLPSEVGFVSILEIKLSKDISLARIYVSIFGKDPSKSFKLLTQKSTMIRHAIAQNINLRITPKIVFYLDDRLERGDRVLRKLKDINQEEAETGE